MNLRRLTALSLLVLACGEGKLLEPGLDYGPEDARLSAKDDSATSPASMGRLQVGAVLKTTFTTTSRWRAFKFAATAGEKLDVYVDGLRGLDTVAYIYNVSATTGRPYSRAIAKNDDTEAPGWTVGSNTAANPNSSSIVGFVPRYTRDYAVVVTTYQQAGRGTANVVVHRAQAAGSAFVSGSKGVFMDLNGLRVEIMKVRPELDAIAAATSTYMTPFLIAERFAPADLRAAFAANASRPEFIGNAFAEIFSGDDPEFAEYLARSAAVVAAISPARVAATLEEMFRFHAGSGLPAAKLAQAQLGFQQLGAAAIADGASHAFSVRMEESGDWSYLAVVVVNVDTGDVRHICMRRQD